MLRRFKKLFKKSIPWEKMTQKQKAVALAKDVIAQLNVEFYRSQPGVYVRMELDQPLEQLHGCQINQSRDMIQSCSVCAKGSLFISLIMKENHFAFDKFNHGYFLPSRAILDNSDGVLENRLSDIFTRLQLDMVEWAFEVRPVLYHAELMEDGDRYESFYSGNIDDLSLFIENNKDAFTELGKTCILFGGQYRNPRERMIAIMENIIENNGQFVP